MYLSFFLAHSSQSPWNFLSFESSKVAFCYVNEVSLGKHLRMGAGHQETHLLT